MGLRYSAEVFFGTHVPRDSAIGERLYKYIDAHQGTPAPTITRGIVIDTCGSISGGPEWVTVKVDGSTYRFGTHDDIEEPRALPGESGWRSRIRDFLDEHAINHVDVARVGWHFAGSVS